MLLKAYTIHDSKSLQYHSPWFASTDGSAVRSFTDLVNDPNTTLGRHPRDYSLWHVGIWDDNNAKFTPVHPPLHVIDGIACVASSTDQPTLPGFNNADNAVAHAKTRVNGV